jgi:hypothetical protein
MATTGWRHGAAPSIAAEAAADLERLRLVVDPDPEWLPPQLPQGPGCPGSAPRWRSWPGPSLVGGDRCAQELWCRRPCGRGDQSAPPVGERGGPGPGVLDQSLVALSQLQQPCRAVSQRWLVVRVNSAGADLTLDGRSLDGRIPVLPGTIKTGNSLLRQSAGQLG